MNVNCCQERVPTPSSLRTRVIYMMESFFSFVLLIMFMSGCHLPGYAFQKGGREAAPVREPSKTPTAGSGSKVKTVKHSPPRGTPNSSKDLVKKKSTEERPDSAEVIVNVSPADSTILLDGVEHRAENGMFKRAELKPGTYRIVVRKNGYREAAYDLSVAAGDSRPLSVKLEPASGTVNVVPTVANAAISIVNAETDREVGRYEGRANNVALAPGRYQVLVSKDGYQTAVREVTVEDAKTLYLEPPLEPLPTQAVERRLTENKSFSPDAATQVHAMPEGKYLVIYLSGRSGNTESTVGSVDVILDGDYIRSGGGASVTGMLTGFHCQVDFVRLENIAEFSFVEPPGISNQWARVVVRVRPKDSKRAMHFLINWKRL